MLRIWISKNEKLGLLEITYSRYTRDEIVVKNSVNELISNNFPDCICWPRKFIKKVNINNDFVSCEVDLQENKMNTELAIQLQKIA